MMFTTLRSKVAGTKAKVLAGAVAAGAAMLMAVPSAQAQRFHFGVTVGTPVYVAPAPAYVGPEYVAPGYVAAGPEVVFTGPGYYDGIYFRDYDAWRAHYWARDRHFDRDRFYGRGFDRDRHFDRGRHFDRR